MTALLALLLIGSLVAGLMFLVLLVGALYFWWSDR